MTRKHYDIIAACLGGALADSDNDRRTIHDIANRLVLELELDNSRFNPSKFWARVDYWRKFREVTCRVTGCKNHVKHAGAICDSCHSGE
jgi:hypothetical protein